MVEAIRRGDIPGVQLRLRRELPLPVEELWCWLTVPERMRAWLGEVLERSAETVVVERPGGGDEPWRERLTILERHPPRTWMVALERLGAGWPVTTRLTFALTPRGEGCELSILQEGFAHLALSTCLTEWEAYRRRWRRAADDLAAALSSDPGDP